MAANPADDYDACPDCRRLVDRLLAELDNARRFRSLPDGYVWQDYYSPDEVIRIRTEIEAERDAALATLQQVRDYCEREKACSDALASDLAEMNDGAGLMREQAVSGFMRMVLHILDSDKHSDSDSDAGGAR